jgi:hypothetical protein
MTGIVSTVFLLALSSTVRADMLHVDVHLEKLYTERHNLSCFDIQSAETGYLYAEHFENNNGKHLGFSIAAAHRGPRLGIVRPQSPDVSENPEPTAMVLLGTGLAAAAAFARKKNKKRI